MFTMCTGTRKGFALLFDSTDTVALSQDPVLRSLFPAGYFIHAEAERSDQYGSYGSRYETAISKSDPKFTLVSTELPRANPDYATLDTPPQIFCIDGKMHEINLRQRYNKCLSLFKAVGCSSCPDLGQRCLSEAVGVEVPLAISAGLIPDGLDEYSLMQKYIDDKMRIAGHDFITPTATRTADFQPTFRPYWQHDFSVIDINKKELSKRATDAAVSRKFIKTQCAKCILKDTCAAYRYCKGAFPPEQEIIDTCLPRLDEVFKNSDMPAWQLWALARGAGACAKHSRWNIILTGLELQKDKLVATVHREKCYITPYRTLKTYEEIAKVFKLPMTEAETVDTAYDPVTNPGILAAWWVALNTHNPHQAYGWGLRRDLIGMKVMNTAIETIWTNGRYVSYHGDMYKIADVSKVLSYGRLAGIDKLEIRP